LKIVLFILMTFYSALLLANPVDEQVEQADEAYKKGLFKEALTLYEKALKIAAKEQKGDILAKSAPAFFKDQQQEKALEIFLEAIDFAIIQPTTPPKEEETKVFQEALSLYLDHQSLSASEIAQKIKEKYSSTFSDQPDYHLLGYILSLAYANLGLYPEFFQTFYNSYRYDPNHYLAYKTRAILHIKLFERAPIGLAREQQRQNIYSNVKKAIDRYPNDGTLYRILVAFAPSEKKREAVTCALKIIIDKNIVISRTDILFFIEESAKQGEVELAQQFLNKVKEWYPFSRIVNAAQQQLDRFKSI
jgi:tetratricopeptide (TPR) repeat protein